MVNEHSLNHIAMLLNIRKFWPSCARFVFNTNRGLSVLVLRGHSEFLFSREGITWGDPLAMFIYVTGTLSLIHSLEDICRWMQLWYADDASAGDLLEDLLIWLKLLCSHGQSFGFCPQPAKCFVVVAPSLLDHAKNIFGGLVVQVVNFWEDLLVILHYDRTFCHGRYKIKNLIFILWLWWHQASLRQHMLSLLNLYNLNGCLL